MKTNKTSTRVHMKANKNGAWVHKTSVQDLKRRFKNSGYILVSEIVLFLFSLWVYSSAERNYKEMVEEIVEPVSINYAKTLDRFNEIADNSSLLCFFLAITIFLTIFVFLYRAVKYLRAK